MSKTNLMFLTRVIVTSLAEITRTGLRGWDEVDNDLKYVSRTFIPDEVECKLQ